MLAEILTGKRFPGLDGYIKELEVKKAEVDARFNEKQKEIKAIQEEREGLTIAIQRLKLS